MSFVVGLLFVSGVALAEWLANGTGSGYAKAGNAQNLTTSAAVASASLYPGGTGDLALTVNNPNQFPVTVTSVVGAGPIVSSSAACNAAGHGVTFTSQTGLSLAVPANGSASFVLADSVAMAATSANECQGATFEIPIALTGVSGTGGGGGGPVDADADTFPSLASGGTDCDDTDSTVHPGATETANAVDDDCDGVVDEGFQVLAYPDVDGDGYGAGSGQFFSSLPAGWSTDATDCDDANSSVHPGATEVFDENGVDEDCDGIANEGFGTVHGYPDVDADGYGDFSSAGQEFLSLPSGFVDNNFDCDDANDEVYPGQTEVLNGIDDDCDAVVDEGLGG